MNAEEDESSQRVLIREIWADNRTPRARASAARLAVTRGQTAAVPPSYPQPPAQLRPVRPCAALHRAPVDAEMAYIREIVHRYPCLAMVRRACANHSAP